MGDQQNEICVSNGPANAKDAFWKLYYMIGNDGTTSSEKELPSGYKLRRGENRWLDAYVAVLVKNGKEYLPIIKFRREIKWFGKPDVFTAEYCRAEGKGGVACFKTEINPTMCGSDSRDYPKLSGISIPDYAAVFELKNTP